MGDFSDKSTTNKPLRIPMHVLMKIAQEAKEVAERRPPKRFRTPSSEKGLKFEQRSLSTTRVRQRLCDLMGTDVIRLNDKRYFQKLSQRLQEEYDGSMDKQEDDRAALELSLMGSMDKQEDDRAALENERLRRLMLEGVIDAPNDYRAIVHGEHKQKPKKTKKRKIKRRIRIDEHPSEHDSEHATLTPRSEDDNSTQVDKEEVRTQVEIVVDTPENTDCQDDEDQQKRGQHREEEEEEERPPPKSIIKKSTSNREDGKLTQQHARPPHHDHVIRSSSSCSTHRKARRVKSAAPRLSRDRDNQSDDSSDEENDAKYDTMSLPDYNRRSSKYSKQEPESIRRLRQADTVKGLYSIAEELVSRSRASDSTNEKKVETRKTRVT